MSESAVSRANLHVCNREGRVKFDSALIEFERSLKVASELELAPSRGGLQSLGRRAERLFQRLIEARQRIRGLSQLRTKACGYNSQLVHNLIPLTDVRLLFGQDCTRPAVERLYLQMVAIAGIADRLGDHHLAAGLAADQACHVWRQLCGWREVELRQGAGDLIDAQNVQIGRLRHRGAQSCV